MVLRLRYEAPGAWEKAKCAGIVRRMDDVIYDPFFEEDEADAVEFCNEHGTCPIRDQCLLYALTNNEKSGVWGGMTELDRKAMRKRWPLRFRGRSTVPREEWRWYPPGEPSSWFDLAELQRELRDEMERGDEETYGQAG